jgi:hypothetical protein
MKKITAFALTFLFNYFLNSGFVLFAQEPPLTLDHKGPFEILTRTEYNSPGCSFPKNDMAANFLELTRLINLIRQNTVLVEMKGFRGYARIRPSDCKDDGQYGVPAELSIEFCDYFKNKNGEITYSSIEPPCWKLITNRIAPVGHMFYSDRFPHHRNFFTVPEKKETIAPGIDLYDGECVVIYNPNRPDYWLPVTVKEAFDLVLAKYNNLEDKIQREMTLEMLNGEWEQIPQNDYNKPATFSGFISKVGVLEGFPKIMKVNPAYWDNNRPKSDIQFIYFQMVTNQEYLDNRLAESKKHNSLGSSLLRFHANLNAEFIKSFSAVIEPVKSK